MKFSKNFKKGEWGKTFNEPTISRMIAFFTRNAAAKNRKDSIKTLYTGIRILTGIPISRMDIKNVNYSMDILRKAGSGHASEPRFIEFFDADRNITTSESEPVELSECVFDVCLEMVNNEPGWSVFALSILEGFHCVMLTMNNTPWIQNTFIYWSDNWKCHKGEVKLDKKELDEKITNLTKGWWKQFSADKRPETRITLWRVIP